MELLWIFLCIFLLLKCYGGSYRGRTITNPDPEEIDYVIPGND